MSILKVSFLFLLISAACIMSSCTSPAGMSMPTLYPTQYVPTVIAMTVAAQATRSPVRDLKVTITVTASPTFPPTPTPSEVPPTEAPTATPTLSSTFEDLPAPEGIPQSPNQILSPGSGSKVISPFTLRAALKPSQNSIVHIELLGEDGRLLMREIRRYRSPQTEWLSLVSDISFGINGIEESGHLQISVEDEQGRLASVSSVDLILGTAGDPELSHPSDLLEDIVIESPLADHLIQDSNMRVSGQARTRSGKPLRIEILSSDGRIVGTRQVSVTRSGENSYGTFAIDVPYMISSTQSVRVQVWEPGDRNPGIVNLSSVEVLLAP